MHGIPKKKILTGRGETGQEVYMKFLLRNLDELAKKWLSSDCIPLRGEKTEPDQELNMTRDDMEEKIAAMRTNIQKGLHPLHDFPAEFNTFDFEYRYDSYIGWINGKIKEDVEFKKLGDDLTEVYEHEYGY
jgi:hypothetical protein